MEFLDKCFFHRYFEILLIVSIHLLPIFSDKFKMPNENKNQFVKTDEPRNVERPIYKENSTGDNESDYKSQYCCFARTFCCCVISR